MESLPAPRFQGGAVRSWIIVAVAFAAFVGAVESFRRYGFIIVTHREIGGVGFAGVALLAALAVVKVVLEDRRNSPRPGVALIVVACAVVGTWVWCAWRQFIGLLQPDDIQLALGLMVTLGAMGSRRSRLSAPSLQCTERRRRSTY